MKYIWLMVLASVISGCTTWSGTVSKETYTQKNVNLNNKGTFSILTTDSEHNNTLYKGLDQRIYITHVDNEYLYEFLVLPISIEKVNLHPGQHEIRVQFRYKGLFADGCLELNSVAGQNYIVRKKTQEYSVSFWLENTESGEVVGNLCGFKKS